MNTVRETKTKGDNKARKRLSGNLTLYIGGERTKTGYYFHVTKRGKN